MRSRISRRFFKLLRQNLQSPHNFCNIGYRNPSKWRYMSTDVLISNRLSVNVNAVPMTAAAERLSSVQFSTERFSSTRFSSTRFSAICFSAKQSVKGNAFQPESDMWIALRSASSDEYSHREARPSEMLLGDWID
ncbi:MAG: hypothetical protein HLUCCA11_12425 [Phormidesmis priestleyi Ana]|uniref:Uncharacterized protein n=1 Tax=Phormidesmis priestleyi Ana TaxID=1666911 RepID=A0A0P7YXK7_9CYAN|nr:MAG: hypothetical protein HLUCCA11_12425 [Phormidesmis priestleyi Ana]